MGHPVAERASSKKSASPLDTKQPPDVRDPLSLAKDGDMRQVRIHRDLQALVPQLDLHDFPRLGIAQGSLCVVGQYGADVSEIMEGVSRHCLDMRLAGHHVVDFFPLGDSARHASRR
jgi:hypothetical protein